MTGRPYIILVYILLLLLLLCRVALVAQRPIVVKLLRERSVGVSVRTSSALWKNGGSDPDLFGIIGRTGPGMRHSGVWGSVHGKGHTWGRIWGAPL